MSQHEEYTSPPGFRVSGAGGTKLAPVLIDPAAPASEGYVITRVGSGYAPQAASGGGTGVQVVTVPISSAELLALNTTPKVLVAAPGLGRMVVPLGLIARSNPGNTPYTNPGTASLAVGRPDAPGFWVTLDDQLLTSSAARVDVELNEAQGFQNEASVADNLPVILSSPGEAYTLGDGTLAVTVIYLVA